MPCQCLSACSRTILQHVVGQPGCLRSHLCKLVIVLAVIFAFQFLVTTTFEIRLFKSLFTLNSTDSTIRSQRDWIADSRGLLFPSHNSSFNGSMRVSMDRTGETGNSSFNLTTNAVGNASSFVFGVSVSSVNPTAIPSLTVPFTGKSLCPPIPPNLTGPITVSQESPSFDELEEIFPMLELGGHYRPQECKARDRVAILVPYRNRTQHLPTCLLNLHTLLQRQQLDYGIFVIEQAGDDPFNRGKLMNVGFVEALKLYNYDCFIFHDIDLMPEDDRNLYNCPEQPRHMSVYVDKWNYKIIFQTYFGGVTALTRTQFEKVNGFSNVFWGWGGEDDDLYNRVRHHGYNISRYPENIARYKTLTHRQATANPKAVELRNIGRKRFKTDGLNSLQYNVKELNLNKVCTRILVELGTPS